MANSVYQVNKNINKSIELKGLRAQYIWYLGGGMVVLLVLYAVMYLLGVNSFVCLAVILMAGAFTVFKVYGMSNKYGEHGLMKAIAKRSVPKVIKNNSRKVFIKIAKEENGRNATNN